MGIWALYLSIGILFFVMGQIFLKYDQNDSLLTTAYFSITIGLSGLTAIFTWFVWSIFIYVIGVKLFPDKESKTPFKKILIGVGYAHAPGILRFFAVTPELMIPIIFITQFWIFAGLIISTKQILNLKSNFKSFGIVILAFLIIAFISIAFVMSRMNAIPISTVS